MSISSEITRITNKRDASFAKVALKGVIVPSGSTIDDLPDLIDSISIDPTYSVTKNLTSVTSSCDDTKVIQGNSFFTELTPASGYVISSVTVTMGGVDITDQVFKAGTGAKTITANGTYSASADNLSGYTAVSVSVPSQSASLGTKSITQNGTYNASSDGYDGYSQVTVSVSGGTPSLQAKTNISPTTSSQTITADNGYDGLSSVQINAMPSGSAGTPTATKGTVSNHSITVTPSVTNTTGYITGSTINGTAVTVSASELVSGSETKTANGTYDVTNLAELIVNVGGGSSQFATGEITLTSDFSLTTSPQNIPNLQLSFQPDFFYIIMNRTSFTSVSSRSGGLYGLIAVRRNWSPPFASSTSATPETVSNDYTFLHYVSIYTNSNISTGVGLGNHGQIGASYYGRYSVNANGTISVGRYSSASTKMFAGTYRYFAVKI